MPYRIDNNRLIATDNLTPAEFYTAARKMGVTPDDLSDNVKSITFARGVDLGNRQVAPETSTQLLLQVSSRKVYVQA